MSKSSTAAALSATILAGMVVSILFAFALEYVAVQTIKSDFLTKTFGIQVNLDDELKPEEFMPAIQIMVLLWLFFALMRIVHHNVDFVFGIALSFLPDDARKILTLGGLKKD
tara:strand:+ start:901 stop:1236 length:336 start_codon:yes stop_codon:yes gene_type:complete